ncbi:MAG: beta-class carbonic anhydrase [Acidimicrobiales bacterium]
MPAMFQDLLAANARFADGREPVTISGQAQKGLAVVTCIDTRIDPLEMLGLVNGDAKILRNAGARVTDDVLRSLGLASRLLGVTRVALIQHTDCRMASATQQDVEAVFTEAGVDPAGWDFLTIDDQVATLTSDLERIRSCPLVADGVVMAGFIYDVVHGRLTEVVPPA